MRNGQTQVIRRHLDLHPPSGDIDNGFGYGWRHPDAGSIPNRLISEITESSAEDAGQRRLARPATGLLQRHHRERVRQLARTPRASPEHVLLADKRNDEVTPEITTLPGAVRNLIHHPENPHGALDDDDLRESIELLLTVAKRLPDPLLGLT